MPMTREANHPIYFNDLPPEAQEDMQEEFLMEVVLAVLGSCSGRTKLYFKSSRDDCASAGVFKLLNDIDGALGVLEEFRLNC